MPTGAHAVLSTQVGRLSGMLSTAQGHLSNAIGASGCSSRGPPKTCTLLSEIRAVLQSAQQEILHAADTLAATVRAPDGSGCLGAADPCGYGIGVSLLLFALQGDSPGDPPAAHQLEPLGNGGAGAGREVGWAPQGQLLCWDLPGTHSWLVVVETGKRRA